MCPEVFEILDFLTQPADSNDEHHDIQDHQSHCQNRNDHPEDQRSYNLHFPPESGNKNADASALCLFALSVPTYKSAGPYRFPRNTLQPLYISCSVKKIPVDVLLRNRGLLNASSRLLNRLPQADHCFGVPDLEYELSLCFSRKFPYF